MYTVYLWAPWRSLGMFGNKLASNMSKRGVIRSWPILSLIPLHCPKNQSCPWCHASQEPFSYFTTCVCWAQCSGPGGKRQLTSQQAYRGEMCCSSRPPRHGKSLPLEGFIHGFRERLWILFSNSNSVWGDAPQWLCTNHKKPFLYMSLSLSQSKKDFNDLAFLFPNEKLCTVF